MGVGFTQERAKFGSTCAAEAEGGGVEGDSVVSSVLDATHSRPFVPSIKSHFGKISSTFGDKCPQNGSKTAPTAPRPHLGYPHIGPFVESFGNSDFFR